MRLGYASGMAHLRIIEPSDAAGTLAEMYARMASRKMPPVYQPAHGGLAGIIRAHSLDPGLMPKAFGFSSGVNQGGPLSWPHRELVATTTSRLNQCFY
jgi:hypothetical protein